MCSYFSHDLNNLNYRPKFNMYSQPYWPNQYNYIRQLSGQPAQPIQIQRFIKRINDLEIYITQMNQKIYRLEQTSGLHTIRLNSLNERLKTVEKTLTIIPESEA